MKGLLSNIQRFSTQDGPGLRTTVFLKGCPLRCPWCHNLETWEAQPSLLFYEKDCATCMLCVKACPKGAHRFLAGEHSLNRQDCILCGACADACPSGALEVRGEWVDSHQLIGDILRDKPFFDSSGGGLTLSGGEALMQFEFTQALLSLAKQNGLHTCLDTSGFGGDPSKLCTLVDLFLFDLKETDAAQHLALTGVALAPILQALKALDQWGASIRLRCPIIPGINDRLSHTLEIGRIANSLGHVQGLDLIPYHPLGTAKAAALGMCMPAYGSLVPRKKEQLLSILLKETLVPVQWL